MYIAIVAQCSCELLIHIPYVIRDTFRAPWTNSGETWAISTNSMISHIWKAFDLGNSLLESNHDLYRSPLHLEQLIRSSRLRYELFAWGNSGTLSERNGRWLDAKEGEEGWYQSISSLSEWQGWVPFKFLVVRYLSKDYATVGITKTRLLIPLAICLSTVFHLSCSVSIRDLLFCCRIIANEHMCAMWLCPCVRVCGYCFVF